MKPGDMVRFAMWKHIDPTDSKKWNDQPKPHIGILVAHDKLMGTAYILYEGEVIKIRSQFAEKAGRKDFNSLSEESCV